MLRRAAFAAIVLFSFMHGAFADVGDYLGPRMPYAAFDALPHATITLPGGTVDIALVPGRRAWHRSAVLKWTRDSIRTLTRYLGRFPVKRLRLLIVPVPGAGISGVTWGYRGAATRITIGEAASDSDIVHSWVLAHELVHVGFPLLPRQQLWLEEGLSTYVGPVARAQAGLVPASYVWRRFLWGMPQGLPQTDDQGLDHTHTWGRTFWGGGLFFLLADIDIRRQTDNRHSLRDAVRAVVAAGGNTEVEWPLVRVLDIADRATGTHVLSDLYRQMRATPVDVDLKSLWGRLGVAEHADRVAFDDAAPLARIRKDITE